MGYCYRGKRLVCDVCGNADGTSRKRKCPYGWCYPPAICKSCWNKKEIRDKFHQYHADHECQKSSRETNEKYQKEQDMIDGGKYIRCSALSVDDNIVHVIFRGKTNNTGRYMQRNTYRAIRSTKLTGI